VCVDGDLYNHDKVSEWGVDIGQSFVKAAKAWPVFPVFAVQLLHLAHHALRVESPTWASFGQRPDFGPSPGMN
jgi:hypothetical protein